MKTVASVGEFALIQHLATQLAEHGSGAADVVGIGDDCAVVPLSKLGASESSAQLVVTTDAMVDGVHFDSAKMSFDDVGYKLVASSVSDISAMGGTPTLGVVGLQVPPSQSVDDLDALYAGIREAGEAAEMSVLGGDTVAADTLSMTLTVVGYCEASPVLRSGAAPGDDLWVSGPLGASFLGLQVLQEKLPADAEGASSLVAAHCRPPIRVAFAKQLAQQRLVSAMIDISDGLLQDARHLAVASNVGVTLELTDVPLARSSEQFDLHPAVLLSGGEDYELLFSASPDNRSAIAALGAQCGVEPKRVGALAAQTSTDDAVFVATQGEVLSAKQWIARNTEGCSLGYDHFAR